MNAHNEVPLEIIITGQLCVCARCGWEERSKRRDAHRGEREREVVVEAPTYRVAVLCERARAIRSRSSTWDGVEASAASEGE